MLILIAYIYFNFFYFISTINIFPNSRGLFRPFFSFFLLIASAAWAAFSRCGPRICRNCWPCFQDKTRNNKQTFFQCSPSWRFPSKPLLFLVGRTKFPCLFVYLFLDARAFLYNRPLPHFSRIIVFTAVRHTCIIDRFLPFFLLYWKRRYEQ